MFFSLHEGEVEENLIPRIVVNVPGSMDHVLLQNPTRSRRRKTVYGTPSLVTGK
jgi:hypothetical protein